MVQFTQKWAIASLLEDIPEGSSFYYTDFPLHVTLAGVFGVAMPGKDIVNEIRQIVDDFGSFEIEGDQQDMFGLDADIAVMKIKKTPQLLNLYSSIHNRLVGQGAVYNSPEHEGTGFIAHSTFQKSGRLNEGEKRIIKSVSIIDLFPDGDGYQRKIFKTFTLK